MKFRREKNRTEKTGERETRSDTLRRERERGKEKKLYKLTMQKNGVVAERER